MNNLSNHSDFRVNTRYQILTPSGFQTFDGIRRQEKTTITLTFDTNESITTTPNHLLQTNEGWKETQFCSLGNIVIGKDLTLLTITNIKHNAPEFVYDPINVAGGHAYESGPVISHNCSFLSTQYTLIRPDVLKSLTHNKPIDETEDGYKEYVKPDPTHTYMMLVDTASGQGLDYSTFIIVDVTQLPYVVVATYANNKVTTMEFPQIIMQYSKRYHTPWLMVEVMDIGRDVAFIMWRDFEYPRFMATMTEKRLGQRLVFNSRVQRHLGLRMTTGVKRSGCAVIKALVENRQVILNDYRIVQQLSVFVQQGSTYKAEINHHDDLVMPLVMFAWVTLQPNFAEITTIRALDAYINPTEPGEIIEGEQLKAPIVPANVHEEKPLPFGIMDRGGYDDDSSWLISGVRDEFGDIDF